MKSKSLLKTKIILSTMMGLMNGNKQELLSMNYLKMVIFSNAPFQLDPKSSSASITLALLSSLRIYKFQIHLVFLKFPFSVKVFFTSYAFQRAFIFTEAFCHLVSLISWSQVFYFIFLNFIKRDCLVFIIL